jgi:D-alanyl-lipoteichoic acid acyltransferase DltB (MBOAT superfamily)
VQAVSVGIGVVAAALFIWIVSRPSSDMVALIGRLDHLAFCACAGHALSRLPILVRKWALSIGSVCILGQHTGWTPVGIVLGAAVLGFAALQVRSWKSLWAAICVQAAILAGTFLTAWLLRSSNPLMALSTQGLFAFVLLRHLSFVVETRRGHPGGLANYLCYIAFYPVCLGASEVYNEFHDRNLTGQGRYDYRNAVRHVISGSVQIWVALLLPVSFETTVRIDLTAMLWLSVVLLFIRSALFIMGLWAVITACGCFYGIELRPNFAGILRCENPSQFWHSWRGTMTRWLIQYVYIPLGGNRRLQTRNITAAFAVSTLWHCMGIPFVTPRVGGWDFAPVILWGAFNAVGVVAYAAVRQHRWSLPVGPVPVAVRRGVKIFLTACFGTFTVTLLGFGSATIEYFGSFLRTLVGLQTW